MKFALLLSILLTASLPTAHAQDCVQILCGRDYCSNQPSQLVAKFPAGMQISSIHNGTTVTTRGEAALLNCAPRIRLLRTVSLDQASIYGGLEIAGTLRATGILRFEPNDGGELMFEPTKGTFNGAGAFFKNHFWLIKLDGLTPPVTLKVPRSLSESNCWKANATAEISDFEIAIVDSSKGGTYARKGRITDIHAFTKCTWGGP